VPQKNNSEKIKKMDVIEYQVRKIRFGSKGKWDNWEYSALYPQEKLDIPKNNLHRGSTEIHNSIESLAGELATYPDIEIAEFISDRDKHGPRVSLSTPGDVLTQYGTVTEEELGRLGSLIQKTYASKKPNLPKQKTK